MSFISSSSSPVIYFPDESGYSCEDYNVGNGFNTFGFVAMMLAIYNAVTLVASNNRNNNNNNNVGI